MGRQPRYRREREELAAVLAYGPIRRAPNLVKILTYICEQQFKGKAAQIKEFNIAVEALGRPATFDSCQNSIVRVEAHNLRKRLREYYETVGADHEVKIHLSEVGYVPEFRRERKAPAGQEDGRGSETKTRGAGHNESNAGKPAVGPPSEAFAAAEDASQGPAGTGAIAAAPAFQPLSDALATGQPARSMIRRRTAALLAACAVVAVIAAVLASFHWNGRRPAPVRTASAASGDPASSGLPPATAAAGEAVRINCGWTSSDWVDGAGDKWLSDRYFTGGAAIRKPNARIQRTFDQDIFRTAREGDFQYRIPLPPGVYELHLHLAEIEHGLENSDNDGTSQRRFSVTLNGEPLLKDFDIVLQAGGASIAEERVFTGISPAADGHLALRFSPFLGLALVSGIEILPGEPGQIRPVRIVMNGLGGRLTGRWGDVIGTNEPGLYAGQRWGQFSYAIPVADGEYTIRLMFAESNFGVTNFGVDNYEGGGAGCRLFDVYCNGTLLLDDFDVFREAGGPNRAVVRTFRNVRPNGSGKLLLSFLPVKDYPMVRAIEVLPETD